METAHFETLVPRLASVQAEVSSIRRALAAAIEEAQTYQPEPPRAEPARSQAPPPQSPPPQPPQPPWPQAAAPTALEPRTDWESLLAGRWLHLAGLLLVFLGTAFFLKVAFDHNWIVPPMRVAMGLLAGAGLIAYAQRFASQGKTYFSEGLTALGGAIEFLSLYTSNAVFHLASPALALTGMVAVNAAIAAIAWRRSSERLGIMAALGGFFAPALAGVSGDPWMIAGYIALLNAGLLLLGELVQSKIIAPLMLAGTLLYAITTFPYASGLNDLQRAAIYGLLYATFACTGWIVAKLRAERNPMHAIVGGIAMGGLLAGLESSLAPSHRPVLAGALLTLAALHLTAAIALKSRYQSWFAALALTFSIPAAFNGAATNIAWAAEAVVLALAGSRFNDGVLRIAGVALLGIDVLRDVSLYVIYKPAHVILNERFASGAAATAAAFTMAMDLYRNGTTETDDTIAGILRASAHVLALLTLCTEAWSAVQFYGGTAQGSSAALSVIGAAFAGVLIACGLYKRDTILRWEGLGLIVLTAAKVLTFDLSFLDISYRVISAVLVGIALIAVSYAYQRRSAVSEAGQ